MLFGLDMLKRHKACIDLGKDALVIEGREIKFLAEHELPKFGDDEAEVDEQGKPISPPAPPAASTAPRPAASTSTSAPFPGSGNRLASPAPSAAASAPSPAGATTSHSEATISSLMAMGVGREESIKLLDAAGGNAEMAASLLFSGGFD